MFDFFRKKKKDNKKEEDYIEDSYSKNDEDNKKYNDKEIDKNKKILFESDSSQNEKESDVKQSLIDDEEKLEDKDFYANDTVDKKSLSEDYNEKDYKEPLVEDKNELEFEDDQENTGFFGRIRDGLIKTRDQFSSQIKDLFTANVKIDDDMYEELEDILISADVGMNTTLAIVDSLRDEINDRSIKDPNEIYPLLEEIMIRHLDRDNLNNDLNIKEKQLAIILVIGVNGVGKTTTIGKLAYSLQSEGKSVMLAAADTFRAAAIEQLGEWSDKANVEMVSHSEGADPSAVIFDAIKSAKNKNVDVLICDTAGRLHNKKNLMKELEKINKTIDSHAGSATRENLLVLDATTGQNAVNQLREFKNVTEITGLILTKLDGTAKGGIIFPLQYELNVPVKYIGLGEGIDNLEKFDSKSFVDAMF